MAWAAWFLSHDHFFTVYHIHHWSMHSIKKIWQDFPTIGQNGFLINDFEHFLWTSFHNDDDNVAIIRLPSVPSCYSKFAKEWILNFQISEGDWFIFLSVNFGQLTTVLHRRELSLHNVWRVMVQKQLFMRLNQISSQTLYFLISPINQFHISQRIIAQKTSEPRVAP